jgi:hypothetical protein
VIPCLARETYRFRYKSSYMRDSLARGEACVKWKGGLRAYAEPCDEFAY